MLETILHRDMPLHLWAFWGGEPRHLATIVKALSNGTRSVLQGEVAAHTQVNQAVSERPAVSMLSVSLQPIPASEPGSK